MTDPKQQLLAALTERKSEIVTEWLRPREDWLSQLGQLQAQDMRRRSEELYDILVEAMRTGESDISSERWAAARDALASLSSNWASLGLSPTEIATFVLSLKQPLFKEIQRYADDVSENIWRTTLLFDQLALLTFDSYTRSRETIISLQREELLELSTPVVELWQGILILPLIGTLDSARTQVVMETLLAHIMEKGSTTAIIDITGVPTVDTLVAQHLLKTVAAARLMGADCIISGIRPQIAQTIVHLGVQLGDVTTKASLADAFALALSRQGQAVTTRDGDPIAGG